MKKKSQKSSRNPTLKTFELVEVTDPAEIAELERRVRAAEKEMAAREADTEKPKPRKRKRRGD
jgi:hypothetical protein